MSFQISEENALKLIKKGNIDKAVSILKTLITTNSASQRAILTYSILLFDQGKFEESVKYLVDLVQNKPLLSKAHLYLGRCYEILASSEKALKCFWDAAITDINSWEPYYYLANIYAQAKDEDAAVKLYKRAIRTKGCESEVILKSVESVISSEALLSLKPYIATYLVQYKNDFNTTVAQALLYEKLGNTALSSLFYLDATQLTNKPSLVIEILKSFIRIKQVDQALTCSSSIIKKFGDKSDIIAYISLLLQIANKDEALVELLSKYSTNKPLIIQCLRLITDHITACDSLDKSISFLSSLLHVKSVRPLIQYLLAQVSFDEGYYTLALTWIDQIPSDSIDIQISSLRGASLLNMGLFKESVDCHYSFINNKKLLNESFPEFAFLNLAQSLRYIGDPINANIYYLRGLRIAPKCDELLEAYFKFLIDSERIQEAINISQGSFSKIDYKVNLADISPSRLCLIVYTGQAISELYGYQSAYQFIHNFHSSVSKLLPLFILSDVYSHDREAYEAFNNYKSAIEYLRICTNQCINTNGLRRLFGTFDNFHLAYLMTDVVDTQYKYAACISTLYKEIQDNLNDNLVCHPYQNRERRLRIGFASANLCSHNGWTTCSGLIDFLLSTDSYDIYTFSLGPQYDSVTSYWANNSLFHRYIVTSSFNSYSRAAHIIAEANLDLLIYTDIGMGPTTRVLSSLRLARYQGSLWGHPLTTGSQNVDFFISSNLMESANASSHYTEQLVLLDNNGLYYPTPSIPDLSSSSDELGIPTKSSTILSVQTVYKYHPQFDFIYPRISLACPGSMIIFIKTHPSSTRLRDRIFREYEDNNLDPTLHVKFINRLTSDQFKTLFYYASFAIDPPGWAGGNVSLQALKYGCPVLTYPTKFMRGRHTYGFLKQLNLSELIAESTDELIDKAGLMYSNIELLESIKWKLKSRSYKLFYDKSAGVSLSQFINELFF